MSEQAAKIIKKKVKPYPIPANLDANGVKKPVEIMMLNEIGAIVRVDQQMLFVGEYYQVIFEIPVQHEFVNTQVRVLKTYDRLIDKKIERLAELRFQSLTNEHKSRIVAFMAAIGQVK